MSDDRQFFDTFMLILGILILFTVAVYFLAGSIAGNAQASFKAEEPLVQEQIAGRISPVARVAVRGGPAPKPVVVAAVDPEPRSAVEVYNAACVACHSAGIAGAPKVGDAGAWADRIAQGNDVMYGHAINGFQGAAGVMPAKGGLADLSDDEVIAAVNYMVEQSR